MTTEIEVGAAVGAGVAGFPVITKPSPLTRLNYFDGKFLRAEDLQGEQAYHRRLVAFSNQAGGHGVVHGYDTTLESGAKLAVGGGLAVNRDGYLLYLDGEVEVGVQELIDASRALAAATPQGVLTSAEADFTDCDPEVEADPGGGVTEGTAYYLITIGPAYARCGEEDVFGRLCEDACATATDRPHIVDGIVLRAHPLLLPAPLPTSTSVSFTRSHLRSRFASAYFRGERLAAPSLLSAAGLAANTWCLGADGVSGSEVPLAVIARQGTSTLFLDAWVARRELIETTPRRFWATRMRMRPWDVYLAHVLQFQCQLSELLSGRGPVAIPPGLVDRVRACLDEDGGEGTVTDDALVGLLERELGDRRISSGMRITTDVRARKPGLQIEIGGAGVVTGMLLDGGIVELPSAGYLPVSPGDDVPVDEQVRRIVGDGLDLRFCAVRADFVGEAFEEAQHMDRISLTRGLDDPDDKPLVDVLVPDGEVTGGEAEITGVGFDVELDIAPQGDAGATASLEGIARGEALPSGGFAGYFAGSGNVAAGQALADVGERLVRGEVDEFRRVTADEAREARARSRATLTRFATAARTGGAEGLATPRGEARQAWMWMELRVDANLFALGVDGIAPAKLVLAGGASSARATLWHVELEGVIRDVRPLKSKPGIVSTFTGSAVVDQIVDGTVRQSRETSVVKLQLVVVADVTGGAGTIGVALTPPDQASFGYFLSAQFSGEPTVGKARLDLAATRKRSATETITRLQAAQSRTIAHATFKEDGAVFESTHPSHVSAASAVAILAAQLDDVLPDLAERAGRLLLDPGSATTQELEVKATRDWVMFHRRRVKDCGEAAPAPEPESEPDPVETDEVVVYHVPVTSIETSSALCEALEAGVFDALHEFGATEIGRAEFVDESATMLTDGGQFGEEIRSAFEGRLTAGFARMSLDLGLLDQRTEVMGDAVGELPDSDTGCETSLEADPPDQGWEGSGALFIVSVPVVDDPEPDTELFCHQVILLRDIEPDTARRLFESAAAEGSVLGMIGQLGGQSLGVVQSPQGSSDIVGTLPTVDGEGIVLTFSLPSHEDDPAVTNDRRAKIVELTGFNDIQGEVAAFVSEPLGDCPHVWVLASRI